MSIKIDSRPTQQPLSNGVQLNRAHLRGYFKSQAWLMLNANCPADRADPVFSKPEPNSAIIINTTTPIYPSSPYAKHPPDLDKAIFYKKY